MDLSGLPETAVDSDEDDDDEDVGRGTDPLMSRDIVRDCLEKDPMDRTDDDIGKPLLFELFHYATFSLSLSFSISVSFSPSLSVYRAVAGVCAAAPGICQSECFSAEGTLCCHGVCGRGKGRNRRAQPR